ncbi:MAG: glutathione S-transferase family protein [Litoreibacter sp.]
MKLLYQTHSPFARKALVFAHEAGLADQLEVIHHETSPTNRNDEVFASNPLGKVPVLVLESGENIFDSSVICTYFDDLHAGTKLIPTNPVEKYTSLCLEALADGMSEAGIWARWESVRRPEHLRHDAFLQGQLLKLIESYDYIEAEITLTQQISIGEIALATSLSWLEFRGLPTFRESHTNLSNWFDGFSQRPSMQATTLSGDTHD